MANKKYKPYLVNRTDYIQVNSPTDTVLRADVGSGYKLNASPDQHRLYGILTAFDVLLVCRIYPGHILLCLPLRYFMGYHIAYHFYLSIY